VPPLDAAALERLGRALDRDGVFASLAYLDYLREFATAVEGLAQDSGGSAVNPHSS